jgi:MATE family multidrug resistance protein
MALHHDDEEGVDIEGGNLLNQKDVKIIPKVFATTTGSNDGDNHQKNSSPVFTFAQHMQQISSLTGPIILSEIFQNTLPIVDIAFVGRMTTKEDLAAAALATVWFNLWNSTMLGFCTAIDTLLSQSFGAGEYETFAMWSGFSLVIVSLVTIIITGLIALCHPMMVAFGQDPAIAAAAGQFSYRLLPGLLPYYIFKVMIKHLQAQNILIPGVMIGIFANVFNVFTNWFFISYLKMGLNGAPLATTVTRCLELIMIVFYFYWKKSNLLSKTWPTFSVRNLKGEVVMTFLKMAVSSALSFSAEAWSFEITTILAGLLGTVELDAHIIAFTIVGFLYLSFPFAIGVATSIRIGQLIGEESASDAKRSALVSFLLTFIVQGAIIAIIMPISNVLGKLFSHDEDVSQLIAQLIPVACIFMMGDAFQSNAGGVLRGLGRQNLLFLLNMIGFWLLALPSGALLTFVADVGVSGLWWGMTIGIYSSSLIGIALLKFYINWESETEAAKVRLTVVR